MGKTSIEWTRGDGGSLGETWNPVRGCRKISPGCKHCYAEAFASRFEGTHGHVYELGFKPRTAPDQLDAPLRWKKPRRVFVNSMSDLFHERFPFEYVGAVFGVMAQSPRHTYMVMTKRHERMVSFYDWVSEDACGCRGVPEAHVPEDHVVTTLAANLIEIDQIQRPWPLPNVWMGVSVEDRRYGLPRIEALRKIPAAIRFLSIEPLLEDIGKLDLTGISWVIVGGESGHGARPFDLAWSRSVVRQCREAGVACFVKQLGARPFDSEGPAVDGVRITEVTTVIAKGGDPSEWPPGDWPREFPEASR